MIALAAIAILAAEVPAPVTGAVLYGGQARLTRTTEVTVAGHERLELPLLPREADPDSVRVEVSGAELETVDVLRLGPLSLRVGEARAVVAAIERLDDELALARAEDEALGRAAELGDQAPEAPDDDPAVWGSLDPARWRQTLTFLRGWRERLDRRRGAVTARLQTLQRQRAERAQRAGELAAGDEGRIRVVVHVSGHGRARVQTSYLVDGPTWFPRYEVRLDSKRDEVQVALAALAAQRTGDDWNRAALTFSTALPFLSTAAPELPRWTIGERDRFIPASSAQAEPSEPAPEPPAAPGPSPELTELRRRLEALAQPPAKDSPATAPTGAQAVKELLTRTVEVQAGGRASRSYESTAQTDGFNVKGQAGSMIGYVFDQSGNPIRGVKIVASSPTTIGGARTAYTNEEGFFRLPNLPGGVYEVRAMAPKLKTVVQKEIRVGAQPAEVNLVMEVTDLGVEEVKVVEKAPLVQTTSASVKESYDTEFVSSRPSTERPSDRPQQRQAIRLAPPEASYRRPRLAPGLPASLAGGHDLSFDAVAPETLPSGALAQRVPLQTWRWPVSVRRQLFPALRPDAYLVANLRSPAPEPLPAGQAALFLDGQPVGRARLELIRPGQPFTLPLGIDRAVRSRRQVQLESREKGLISKDDVNRYTVVIDVANPHRLGVALDVFDQLPEARDDSVEVKLESSSPPAKVGEHGLVTWHTGLRAGATMQLHFVYTLTRKKGNRLHQ